MLSFINPTVSAISIVAVSRSVITLNVDSSRMLRSRHRFRRYGYVSVHQWEFISV